jgi:DNA-binding transcriptional LysR family regulator
MEIRNLRSFVAVAEAEHFRRAAQTLHLAQPALSRHVTALEKELGVSLFDRLPRGVRLSEPGRVLLVEAKRILDDLGTTAELVKRVGRGQVGVLRIAFSEAASGHAALTEAIRTFRTAQSNVELSLIPMASGPQVEALRQGRIDAGFRYRVSLVDKEFERREMAVENVLLALPKTHRLVDKPVLHLADLRDEPLLCIQRQINPDYYDSLMAKFLAANIAPRVVQEASSTIVLSLVSVGMGLGIVSSAMRFRPVQEVTFRQIKDLSMPSPFDLVWRKNHTSAVLTRFVDNAIAVAANQAAAIKAAKKKS